MTERQVASGASEQGIDPKVEDPEARAPAASEDGGAEAPEIAAVDGAPVAVGGDYLEDLKRLQAEFANYRKRMMKDQANAAQRGVGRLVERLLPVLDNFQRAIDHGEGGPGVELVFKNLKDALAAEGVEEIAAAEGTPFDPTVHEAVESVEDPGVDGLTLRSLYRPGYLLAGRVLRPAMVVVARPPEVREDAASGAPTSVADGEPPSAPNDPSRGE